MLKIFCNDKEFHFDIDQGPNPSKGKIEVTKVKKLASVDVEKIESINKFVDYAVTENRLQQGITYFKENNIELDIKNTGQFVSWIAKDVIKEEIDTMAQNNITTKEFGAKASVKSRQFFINYINSNIGL